MSSKNALQAAKLAAEEEKKKKKTAESAESAAKVGLAEEGSAGEEKAKTGAAEDKASLVSEVAEYLGLSSDAGLGEIFDHVGYEGTIEEIAKNLGVK